MSAPVDGGRIHEDPTRLPTPQERRASELARINVEMELNRARAWLVDTYTALYDVLDVEVTQDDDDPDVGWTVKDHFAHCSRIPKEMCDVVREFLAGTPAYPAVAVFGAQIKLDDGRTVSPTELTSDELGALRIAKVRSVWKQYHDASFSEIVAEGQRVRAEVLELLASLTDEQLSSTMTNVPHGHGDGTVAGYLLVSGEHDRDHLRWVVEGLALHTARRRD